MLTLSTSQPNNVSLGSQNTGLVHDAVGIQVSSRSLCVCQCSNTRLCARALLANNSLHQRVFLQSALFDQGHVVIKQVPEAALSALASGEIVGCGGVWKSGIDCSLSSSVTPFSPFSLSLVFVRVIACRCDSE